MMTVNRAMLLSLMLSIAAYGNGRAAEPSGTAPPTSSTEFTLCSSTYALCTDADCTPIPGQTGNLSCGCQVHTGYSAATQACQSGQAKPGGKIKSRYFPVESYEICSNIRPWAWCLDVPCTIDKKGPSIDKKGPSKATCTCTTVDNQSPWVGQANNPASCTNGIISSATVQGIEKIGRFINDQKLWPPFTPKVLKNPSP
jgi:hypothetical protein